MSRPKKDRRTAREDFLRRQADIQPDMLSLAPMDGFGEQSWWAYNDLLAELDELEGLDP